MSAKTAGRAGDKTPPAPITGSPEQKAQTAAIVGGHTLKLFSYYQPYDLRHADQFAALRAVYRTEFNRECPLTAYGSAPVRYLLVVDDEPVLLPEAAVPPFVLGIAFGKIGWSGALKVLYDMGILS
jgi:hypothetical protein